jgi:HEAT repeat protein
MRPRCAVHPVLVVGMLLLAAPVAAQSVAAPSGDGDRVEVPPPWLQQDAGDSLYQAGRAALNRGDYRGASRQFRALREQFRGSGYVGDAYYWEAFARAKLGSKEELRTATGLLDTQAERYPNARTIRDARELRVRIQGDLARLGDATSAAAIAVAADPPQSARGAPSRAAQQSSSSCDEGDDERLLALNALLQMRAEQALPILRQVLERRDEGSVCLRRQAVFLVSQKRSSETAAILLSAARGDPDAEVREHAVFWLSQVDAPEAVAALDSILQHGTDAELQEKAVFALAQQRGAEAAGKLRAHLERQGVSDEVKEHIIFWLGQQSSAENARYLKEFYAKSTSEALKENVLFSLAQMSLDENAQWLLGVARNEGESVELRKNALFWAGQMKQVPFADLAAMYGSVTNRELKEQLVFVYSQRQGPEAVDKLMEIARTETDPELRKSAVFWLGQSHDPRAVEFLLEIISK